MIAVLLFLVLGGAFLALARWGRRNAHLLVPTSMSLDGQRARARSMRRGAVTCAIAGWLFVAFAVLEAIDMATGH